MTVYKLRIALENAGCAIAESQRPGSLLCKEGRGLVVHFSEGSGLLEHLIVLLKDRHLPHGDLDFTEITTLWRRLQTRRR
jgi:hypothetical protein